MYPKFLTNFWSVSQNAERRFLRDNKLFVSVTYFLLVKISFSVVL